MSPIPPVSHENGAARVGRDLDFDGNKLRNEVAKFEGYETHSFARNCFRDVEPAPREQMMHNARHPAGILETEPSKDFVIWGLFHNGECKL